jgi:hypothetical protein
MTFDEAHDRGPDDDAAALRRALARAISAAWRGSAFFGRDRADPETVRLATERARRLLILAGRGRRVAEAEGDEELLHATGATRNFANAYIVMTTPTTWNGRPAPVPSGTVIGNQLRALGMDGFCATEGYELDLAGVPVLPGFDDEDDDGDEPGTSELLAMLTTGRLGAYRVAAQPADAVVEAQLRKFLPYLASCLGSYRRWAGFFADPDGFDEGFDRARLQEQAGHLVVYTQQRALALLGIGAPVEALLATVVLGLTAESLFLASTAADGDELRRLPLLTETELDFQLAASGVGAWLGEQAELLGEAEPGAA